MTTVPPPSTPLPQIPAAAANAQPVATVTTPPAALALLEAGAAISGIATPTPDPRVTLLSTAAGDVALRTPQPVTLPDGAKLTLEVVRANAQQLTVRFTAVNDQPLQAAQQQPRATPTPVATVVSPTPALAATPVGTRITGTIERGPDPRIPVLATPQGDIPLRTAVPLPEGAILDVEITRTTPQQVTVRLIALDGQPLQQAPLPRIGDAPPAPQLQTPPPPLGAPGTPPPIPMGQAWWPGGSQPVVNLPVVSAFVVTAPPVPDGVVPTGVAVETPAQTPTTPNAPQPSATSTPVPQAPTVSVFSAGADLSVKITSIALPAAPAAMPLAAPLPNVAGAPLIIDVVPTVITNQPAQPTAPTIVPAMMPPLPLDPSEPAPGLQLARSDGWPTATPQPPTTVQVPTPAAIVTGTVIRIADGVPVLQVDDAEVQLNVRANLPVGTTVTLEVRAQVPTPMLVPPTPPPALVPLSVAQPGWPALNEAVQVLQKADPQAAQQLMNAIPDGGPRTAAAMMSFAQALRTGDTRQWPGDNTLRALERAGPRGAHLAGQIAEEVADLGRQARDVSTDWRALPIPWHADGKVERIRLLMRETDPDAEAEKQKRGGGTRFVIDLDLSRLGSLQVDGMFKKESRGFDVMIRTKAPLPDHMQRDLMGLFANSNAAMNLVGGLTFQVVKKFPDPTAPRVTQDKSGLWV